MNAAKRHILPKYSMLLPRTKVAVAPTPGFVFLDSFTRTPAEFDATYSHQTGSHTASLRRYAKNAVQQQCPHLARHLWKPRDDCPRRRL